MHASRATKPLLCCNASRTHTHTHLHTHTPTHLHTHRHTRQHPNSHRLCSRAISNIVSRIAAPTSRCSHAIPRIAAEAKLGRAARIACAGSILRLLSLARPKRRRRPRELSTHWTLSGESAHNCLSRVAPLMPHTGLLIQTAVRHHIISHCLACPRPLQHLASIDARPPVDLLVLVAETADADCSRERARDGS